MSKNKPSAFIDAFRVHRVGHIRRLTGLVTGHPVLSGRRRPMCTSAIIRYDAEDRVAETVNTRYTLGRPLDTIIGDETGQPQFVAVGGLIAVRRRNSNFWEMWKNGEGLLARFKSDNLNAVLDRLLDVDPPLEDLLHQITDDNLPQ